MFISSRQFFFSLSVLAVMLVAMNAVVSILTRGSVPRRVMAHAREAENADVVAIGNSLVVAGFDESAFDSSPGPARGGRSLNLGLGGSTPVEHLLLFRYAQSLGIAPRLLVYGFYDFQLTSPLEMSTRDFVGNHAILYYLEPEYGLHFYHLPRHDRAEFEIARHFPMIVDRGAIWAKVERLRRNLAQSGMPTEHVSRFGQTTDFTQLEARDTADFIQRCEAATQSELIVPVRELIRQASNAGVEVVFVEMAMPPLHLRRFYDTRAWALYRAHLQTLLGTQGVTYVDASHWLANDRLFADPLHMTAEGAAQFSQRLSHLLKNGRTREPSARSFPLPIQTGSQPLDSSGLILEIWLGRKDSNLHRPH